ncbi:MAG: hypothetical protein ABIF08_01250 [Nanoarchaeota archaeon]
MELKKLLVMLVVLAFLIPTAIADGSDSGNGAQTSSSETTERGEENQVTDDSVVTDNSSDDLVIAPNKNQQQTQNTGDSGQLKVTNTEQVKAKTLSGLTQSIQNRNQEMNQEMESLGQTQQNVLQNQNKVRLAVHAFLAMEDLVGGIGKNVSEIAREFDNSMQKTVQAEERMQTRNIFMFFFFGGDEVSAAEIEEELNMNQNRMEKLQELKEQCQCNEELKNMFQEQMQNIEMEQTRLRELAQEHNMNKGLFGWLFK